MNVCYNENSQFATQCWPVRIKAERFALLDANQVANTFINACQG
uniref:Uncharacterized protein n=1 Tax=Arsenophonus endosymbiont of Trialeurodes vaporariorum TaxID=235567 RepID=A0A3B0LVF1_9GAMM